MERTQFYQAIRVIETDKFSNRIASTDLITGLSDTYYDSLTCDISIEKSITSNSDTANVKIQNHPILEQMYSEKRAFFEKMNEKFYEVDIFQWHGCTIGSFTDPTRAETLQKIQCIYTGDLTDITADESDSITDQALSLSLVSGSRASIRTIVNKKYAAGTTYLAVVNDLLSMYTAYSVTVLDDPLGKLNKTLPKSRTVHRKVSEVLDDICRDLEMTWGFDAARYNMWTGNLIAAPKSLFFVDKASVFDSIPSADPTDANNGVGPHFLDGGTGKYGRIGYTKSQFTTNHATDPALNIGRSIQASDFGTMDYPDDFNTAFLGRINRMSINNSTCHLEAAYIGDNNRAIIEYDKKNSGAWIL